MPQPSLPAATTAVVIAYQSARDLLQSARLLDNEWRKTSKDLAGEQGLMDALNEAEISISRRYSAIYNELGEQFRMGDGISEKKLIQTAQLVDLRVATPLQHAIKSRISQIDYDKIAGDAILFTRAALGILEQLRQLFLPEKLVIEGVDQSDEGVTEYMPDAALRPQFDSSVATKSSALISPESCQISQVGRPRTPSDPVEQTTRFRRFLPSRKANREAWFPDAPASISLHQHFKWQSSASDTSQIQERRDTRPTSKIWYTCADVPVVLDVSTRPSKTSYSELAAWDRWQHRGHLITHHQNSISERSSDDYSDNNRSSSVYSTRSYTRETYHAALDSHDPSSREEISSAPSRSSTHSNASTPLTSPSSLADNCDWAHDAGLDTKLPSLQADLQPPKLPEKSPLRALRTRQRVTAVSDPPTLSTSTPVAHHWNETHSSTHSRQSSASISQSITFAPVTRLAHLPPPSKRNNYHGFCKGAWIIRKSLDQGMKLQSRPLGIYNKTSFFQCRSCSYRFPDLLPRTVAVDMRVYAAAGVLYRRSFLAKSHVKCSSGSENGFCCQFCCAEGRSSCVYSGIEMLMGHIVAEHSSQMDGEVQRETKCILGRVADANEDFDICIPLTSPRGSLFESKIQVQRA